MSELEAQQSRFSSICSSSLLRTGIATGCALVLVMLVSLLLANCVTALEPFAGIRNDASRVIFGLIVLIPIFRFIAHPRRMFASALLAWIIFAAGYDLAGMYFVKLFTCLGRTPFEALVVGIVFYGVVAAVSWVCWMILAVAHNSGLARRHTPGSNPHNR